MMARCCNYFKVRVARTLVRCSCWWWRRWWLVSVGYAHFGLAQLTMNNDSNRHTLLHPGTHTLCDCDTCKAIYLFISLFFFFLVVQFAATSGCICKIRDQTCNRIDTNFKFSFPFRYQTERKRQNTRVKIISAQWKVRQQQWRVNETVNKKVYEKKKLNK